MALSLRGRLVATTVVAAVFAVTVLVVGLQLLLAHQSSRESLSTLQGRADEEIHLTATEFELLRFLMRNPRRVLSKAQILDRVWNYDFGGQAHVVELYISYLRKKIDVGRVPLIHTVRGVGYAWR